ncbi:MAG: aldo/keto reductase [Deltaproteobacteria bacterium]|nr:aldo/keto reductase [Deltaproteobacteria bacterium]MBW2051161.1 aldo/keto reductase [Deltaproteobacteria bacterium]MBW2140013.1 aldo/keto reductase [Deltaproteobacteria bacterium]MBW2322335.1 aldo/keto reductase [Deltaproteobacteria bacterium]
MKQVLLGKTGIQVSELSFGSLILGRLQADLTEEEAAPAVAKAVELGINFFDTAQSYGTQKHLRLGLGRAVNDVVIATKTHARTREDAQKAFEESLKEFGRDYIDIYHCHLIESSDDLANRREVLDFLMELKEKGLIRATGASVHKVEAANVVAAEPDFDILFPVLNSQGLGIPDGSAEEMLQACQLAKTNGKGIYAMKPLAGGHLRGSPKEAFKYLQAPGLVDSICVGMKSPAEVEMNVSVFEGREVPQEVLAQVETVPRTLRIYNRCIGCGSCVEVCDQGALSLDYSQADEKRGKEAQSVVDVSRCILCGYCAEVCPQFVIRVV